MKAILFLFLLFSQAGHTKVCKGMLYMDVTPHHCVKGERVGYYVDGAYHYIVPSHYPPIIERHCELRSYCNPMDTSGRSCTRIEVCNDEG